MPRNKDGPTLDNVSPIFTPSITQGGSQEADGEFSLPRYYLLNRHCVPLGSIRT